MAQFIDMKQVPSGTVTAVDDRIMYDVNLESGIIHGCEISYQGHNMIHINAGYGVIKGGLFEMKDHTEYVDLANSTDTTGQIYLHFDAAAADKLTIISETSSTLHQMVQEEDANFNNGVYEIQLCTYIATQTVLTNVEQTFPAAKGAVDVLDTLQAIMANNEEGKIAGALAVKALNTNLTHINVYVGADKKLHFIDWTGADSVLNFSGGNINQIVLTSLGTTALACALYHDNELIFTCPYYGWSYSLNQSNGFFNITCAEAYGNNFHITLQKSAKVNGTQRASGYAFNILRTTTQTVTLLFD